MGIQYIYTRVRVVKGGIQYKLGVGVMGGYITAVGLFKGGIQYRLGVLQGYIIGVGLLIRGIQ